MQALELLLIIIFLANCVQTKKVSYHYEAKELAKTPVKILIPEVNSQSEGNEGGFTSILAFWSNEFFKKLNATVEFVNETKVGYPDEHGNYSGLVGMIQRQEGDFAMQAVRMGSHKFEPVEVAAVAYPADLIVFSSKGKSMKMNLDILDITNRVSSLAWLWFIFAFYIVAISMTYISDMTKITANLFRSLWNIFSVIFDQEDNNNLKSWSSRVLWTFFCFSIFVGIFGIILNLMSTESVADVQPRRIENLFDIFDPFFLKKVHVHMVTTFFFYEYMTNSEKKDKLFKLYKHMRDTNDCTTLQKCSFIDLHPENPTAVGNILMRIRDAAHNGDGAILMTQGFVDDFMVPTLCRSMTDLVELCHQSSDTIATDVLTYFFNKKTSRHAKNYARYRMTTQLEMGMGHQFVLEAAEAVGKTLNPVKDNKYYNCIARREKESSSEAISLPMSVYKKTLLIFCSGISLSMLTLQKLHISSTGLCEELRGS